MIRIEMPRLSASMPLLLALLLASPAQAADWTVDPARILGDPAFLPLAGEVAGAFSYSYTADQSDFQALPSGPVNSIHRDDNRFLPVASVGLTDTISLSAQLGFGNSRSTDDYAYERLIFPVPTGGGVSLGGQPTPVLTHVSVHSRAIGADNPQFNATWRAIDERTAPVDLDVSVGYAPDIFQARVRSPFQTGTLASGGQRATAEIALSREMVRFTARLYGIFGYAGRRNDLAPGGFVDDRSAPRADYTLGLQTQTRITPGFAVDAGFSATKTNRFDQDDISATGQNSVTIKPPTEVEPYVSVLFPLAGHHLVPELLYEHAFIGEQDVTGDGFGNRTTKQQSNTFLARLRFAFGG